MPSLGRRRPAGMLLVGGLHISTVRIKLTVEVAVAFEHALRAVFTLVYEAQKKTREI